MAGRGRGRQGRGRHANVPPEQPEPEPDMRDMYRVLQEMTTVMRQQANAQGNRAAAAPPPPPQVDPEEREARALNKFQLRRPPTFTSSVNPADAEEWVSQIEDAFNVARTPTEYRVDFGSNLLQGDARRWWTSIRERQNVEGWNWAQFVELFNTNFIRRAYRQAKLREFVNLVQGDMTVNEYATKFNFLSRYGASLVADGQMKASKFQDGLKSGIRSKLVPLQLVSYDDVVDTALLVEQDYLDYQAERALRKKDKKQQGGNNYGSNFGGGTSSYGGNSGSSGSGSGGKDWKGKQHNSGSSGSSDGRYAPYSRPGTSRLSGSQGNSKEARTCYNCGQTGHIQPYCPLLQLAQGRQDRQPYHEPTPLQYHQPAQLEYQYQQPQQQQNTTQQGRGQQRRRGGGNQDQGQAYAMFQPDEQG